MTLWNIPAISVMYISYIIMRYFGILTFGYPKTKWTSYANEIQEAICRFFKSENNAV